MQAVNYYNTKNALPLQQPNSFKQHKALIKSISEAILFHQVIFYLTMDLIHYSLVPLILFRIPYTLNFFCTIYRLQMALGVLALLNFSYFNVCIEAIKLIIR